MKLTIYVPTYKRDSLYHCLESIVPQLVKHDLAEDDVELIVSDNDPEGSAESVVKPFGKVQYVKQPINLGADGNCIRGLTSGKGKYVWVFGDDDVMLPYGITRTLEEIKNKPDRIIHVGIYHGEVPLGYSGTTEGLISAMQDKSFLIASTLCSMNVWRRDAMDLRMGLTKLDTRNALCWAGLTCKTVKVLDVPSILPGFTPDFTPVENWEVKMGEYVSALSPGDLGDVDQWNYANTK